MSHAVINISKTIKLTLTTEEHDFLVGAHKSGQIVKFQGIICHVKSYTTEFCRRGNFLDAEFELVLL